MFHLPQSIMAHHVVHDHSGGPMKAPTRAQQLRRITKPLMEKKRRDRINKCLDDLKDLILAAMKKDGSQHKLEKADILELTVRYLQQLQQSQSQQMAAALHEAVDPVVAESRYQAGYLECAQEVGRYLSSCDNIDPESRLRVMDHVATRVHQRTAGSPPPPLVRPPYHEGHHQGHHHQPLCITPTLSTQSVRLTDQSSPSVSPRSSASSPALSVGSCESADSGCSAGGPVWRPW